MRRLALGLAFASGAALFTPRAAEAAPSSHLVYVRGAGAETCPEEAGLRSAVRARVGYDPFFPWAELTVMASIKRDKGELVGHVEIAGTDGLSRGARDLRLVRNDCAELVTSMALAISIALDTLDLARADKAPAAPPSAPLPPPPAEERPAPAPVAPVPATSEASPASPAGPRLGFDAGIGPSVSAGIAPALAAGGELFARLRWPAFSLAVEGRLDLPATRSVEGGGAVGSALRAGAVVPCLRFWTRFAWCSVLMLGSLATSGPPGLPASSAESALYAAAGLRLELEQPLFASLSIAGYGESLVTLVPTTLLVRGVEAWHISPLLVTLGVATVVHFR